MTYLCGAAALLTAASVGLFWGPLRRGSIPSARGDCASSISGVDAELVAAEVPRRRTMTACTCPCMLPELTQRRHKGTVEGPPAGPRSAVGPRGHRVCALWH